LVVAGAFLFWLLTLSTPPKAQAQVCPVGGPPPAAPHTTCRPLCETPSFALTGSLAGTGAGSIDAEALNPYNPSTYDDMGPRDCAIPSGTNTWDVKQVCTFHCVHWHTFIQPGGTPAPSTALVTPTADPGSFFTSWSVSCAPSPTKTVNRNVCSLLMGSAKSVTATFATSPDAVAPSPAPVLSASNVKSYSLKLTWTGSADATWLGGYEIYRNGILYSRVGPGATTANLINQLCQTDYAFEVRAFDSANETASNSVNVHTGKCTPANPPNTILHVWPQRTTRSRIAYFHWGSNRAHVRYQCRLDKGKWKKCFPGKTYKRLKPGKHVFRVRAYDAAGKDKTPATWRWTIRR
jgi:hypothetical protein